jgi:hypothetical protein
VGIIFLNHAMRSTAGILGEENGTDILILLSKFVELTDEVKLIIICHVQLVVYLKTLVW